jgi:protein-tyrosine-phosphatase
MRLLFICAGNLMRSVMAECVLRARADEWLGEMSYVMAAESCGLKAEEGSPPHPEALRSLEKLGIPAIDITSALADETLMERADLALTMTRQQCYVLAGTFPDHKDKCYSLVEANGAVEMLLEERGLVLAGGDYPNRAKSVEADELLMGLELAVQAIRGIPREQVRQIPGMTMDVRELMTHFAPCFYQASGIHDPLSGTVDDMDRCAELVDSEVTTLGLGLLALALKYLGSGLNT